MVYSAVPIDAYDLAKMIADGATHEGAVIYPASASWSHVHCEKANR